MKKVIFGKSLYLLKLRLIWGGVIFLLVSVFLWLKIVPTGHITYQKNYQQKINIGQGFIYNFTPQDRVVEDNGLPKIIGDPVYFSVFTPRPFSTAKVTVFYRRNLSEKTPIFETGFLSDNIVWRYNLHPLENRIIDNLQSSWHVLSASDPLILQADNYYQDKDSFLQDLQTNNLTDCDYKKAKSCFATYNYDVNWQPDISLLNNIENLTIDVPLRGAHSMFLYTKTGELKLDFSFVDLNQDKDLDPINLILTKKGEVITNNNLEDKNQTEGNGQTEEKKLSITADNLDPGIYKLEVKISDDVVIKKIQSSTNALVFIRKLWPVSWNQDIEIYTDSNYLQVKALGPASLQTLNFAGEQFILTEPYIKHEFFLEEEINGLQKVILEKDDVILEQSGVFSFSSTNFFNPLAEKVDIYFQPQKHIKYIIADYRSPQTISPGLLANTVEFDLKEAYRENGKYNFIFSLPKLEVNQGYLQVEKIEIEFLGRNLWQKIFNL